MSIFRNIGQAISDACYIWAQEMRQVFRDEGVLIFFIIVPLAYPLLYSWIYNNETVHSHDSSSACAMHRPTCA